MKRQTKIAKTVLKRGNKVNSVYLISKLFIQLQQSKLWYWQKSKLCGTGRGINTDINGIKKPEIDLHGYAQLSFDKSTKAIQ